MQNRTAVELLDRFANRFSSRQARQDDRLAVASGWSGIDDGGFNRPGIRSGQITADGAQLADIAGATAEIAEQILVDLLITDGPDGIGGTRQQLVFQGDGGEDQARTAIAALVGTLGGQTARDLLHLIMQSFNRLNALVLDLPGQGRAGQNRFTVGKNGTKTTVAGVTATLDGLVAQIAQDIEQDISRVDLDGMFFIVNG